MILYQDGYLKLDYDPSTGVLFAYSSDILQEDLLRLYQAFSVLVQTLVAYDIKYLLLDASQSPTTIREEEYQVVMVQLVKELEVTPLQRLAHIVLHNQMQEHHAQQYMQEAKTQFPYAI